MHTSTINPYILDRKYSPPTKKCYPLHTRLNTYRHSYHCLSVWVCMCTYIYIPHMYDHVCSNLFRVDRQMKNVRRTEVDWCHILVTPGVGKAGVAASTEPPFVTNRTNYFEATNWSKWLLHSVVTCKAWLQTALLRTALWRRSSWTLNFDFFSHSAIRFRTPQNHFPRFCFKSIEFSWDFLDAYSPFFWFQASQCGSLA